MIEWEPALLLLLSRGGFSASSGFVPRRRPLPGSGRAFRPPSPGGTATLFPGMPSIVHCGRADHGGLTHLRGNGLGERRKVLRQFLGHIGKSPGRVPQFAGDGI
jgi:hypothetical protein